MTFASIFKIQANCSTNISITFNYAVPYQMCKNRLCKLHELRYAFAYLISGNSTQSSTIADFALFSTRRLDVSFYESNLALKSCQIIINIDPFYKVKTMYHNLLKEQFESRIRHCCNNADTTYILIWKILYVSAFEAEKECAKLGGHLPAVCSFDELSLLETILLGLRFDKSSSPHIIPTRFYPFMGAYLSPNRLSICKVNMPI